MNLIMPALLARLTGNLLPMQTLAGFLALLTLMTASLHADNWVENGDFSDGITHWHGDGKAPADYAPDNPLDKPDPFLSKGLIIPLKSSVWTKVSQDFHGKSSSGVVTIVYMVSPDLTFSDKPDDYVNMPDHIGYDAWAAFNTPPGAWIVFISDFGSNHGEYYELKPKLGSGDPQTFRARITGLTPLADKTVTLACPPGHGNLVVLSVELSDN